MAEAHGKVLRRGVWPEGTAKAHGRRVSPRRAAEAQRIWLEEHPTGEKIYEDEVSDKDIAHKAKVIAEEDAKTEAVVE